MTHRRAVIASALSLIGTIVLCAPLTVQAGDTSPGQSASCGLPVGNKAPEVSFQTIDGKPVTLASLHGSGPAIVTFYQGGWCPYCSKSLDEWNKHVDETKAAGITMVFITFEKPERIEDMQDDHGQGLTVLCDPKGDAARAFGVLFTMSEDTQKKYRNYKIDMPQFNTTGNWDLPHPGTFVIDKAGAVRYAWCNPDYTNRADPAKVIAAAKAAK